MLHDIIEKIGLTKKEAQLYLAVLEIGSNPVSKIATKAKINRVTAYDIIEKLAKRGLVTSFIKAKVKYYSALDPQLVVNDFKKKVEDLEVALPVLKQMNSEVEKKAQVMSFEGLEGIKTIFKHMLSTSKEILMYANIKEIESVWSTFMEDIERKRMEYEIPLKLIAIKDSRGLFMQEYDDEFQRKTQLIDKDLYNFKSTIIQFDNYVATISFKSNVGVIIEDEQIAATHKSLFLLHWNSLDKQSPAMTVRKVGTIKEKKTEEEQIVREDQSSLF